MIIPVKCFTCGKVLADKYEYYKREVRKKKKDDAPIYITANTITKYPEAEVMDYLGLSKMCCRRHILTHVDIE
tara:strand:- start:103 stop:321 length:219 start_codon:yes stop_codon:yes gene_type:complete